MKKPGHRETADRRESQVGRKAHPAMREWLPDDPMDMHAVQLDGDPEIMLALIVEEYVRLGFDTDAILNLGSDSNYRAFHELYRLFGEDGFRRRVDGIVGRMGMMRVTATEQPPDSCCGLPDVIPLELPSRVESKSGTDGEYESRIPGKETQ